MPERRWITRDEIAEIHDSIASKALREVSALNSVDPTYEEGVAEFISHRQAARTIRQIDSLGKFPGQVYRR